jgi:hypothetical protein
MIRSLLSALLAVGVVAAAAPASALDWSDNAIRYQFGPSFAEPGVVDTNGSASAISKNIVSFQHADGYKYGGNFFIVNVLLSSTADKAQNSNAGATEIYAIYRTDFSANKVLQTKAFTFGPIRDVMLEAGIDLSAKNTGFAAQVFKPVVGPVLSLAVPAGFWDVGVLVEKEWNNNGIAHVVNGQPDFASGGRVEFDPTLMFATSWAIPVYGAVSFEGFGNVILPKGKDGFGEQTKTEFLIHPRVMFDAGSLFGTKGYQIGAGYEYWLNKFGDNHANVPGAEQSTFVVEAALHL